VHKDYKKEERKPAAASGKGLGYGDPSGNGGQVPGTSDKMKADNKGGGGEKKEKALVSTKGPIP